jgi:hypothetical protein
MEKILKVGEGCSIVKTFFVMDGIQNNGTALAIVALLLFSSNCHKMTIKTVSTKSFTHKKIN